MLLSVQHVCRYVLVLVLMPKSVCLLDVSDVDSQNQQRVYLLVSRCVMKLQWTSGCCCSEFVYSNVYGIYPCHVTL
jgi:hypothetical protein